MLSSRKNHASRSASHWDLLQPQQKLLYDLEFFLAAVLLIEYIGPFVRGSHSQYRRLHHPGCIFLYHLQFVLKVFLHLLMH